jgi:hypothetical protein
MDLTVTALSCEDGFIALDPTANFLDENLSNHSPSKSIKFDAAARSVTLSYYLTVVNDKGNEFTLYSRSSLSSTKLQLGSETNRVLNALFHKRYFVLFIQDKYTAK